MKSADNWNIGSTTETSIDVGDWIATFQSSSIAISPDPSLLSLNDSTYSACTTVDMGSRKPMPALQLAVELKGDGYPIVCLHGHPGSAQCMTVFTDHLSQRFWTIAPDLRGYGKSQTQSDFEMSDHLADLENLLDRLKIDRCLLLGWSLGGILAMELALKQPDRISGLILLATAARPRGSHPPISWEDNLYTGIASLLNQLKPGWDWNIETFGKRSLYRHLIQQHTTTAYQHIASAAVAAYLQTSPFATRALNKSLKAGYNRLSGLSALHCPALMLVGENDRHITAESSLETAAHLSNCHTHCYPHTAHLFPWEIPAQVMQDIDRWLDKHWLAQNSKAVH